MLAVVSVDRDCQITRHHLTSHHSSLASQPLLMEGLPREELAGKTRANTAGVCACGEG